MKILGYAMMFGVAHLNVEATELPKDQPFLKALGMIETGNNDTVVGKKGERSRYQIRQTTWIDHSNAHWNGHNYYDPNTASVVAVNYCNWLRNQWWKEKGYEPSPYDYYAMWNIGYSAYSTKYKLDFNKLPPSIKDKCQRFYNLYYQYLSTN